MQSGKVQLGVAALTGATGFLGRALCDTLKSHGWRLRVLARPDVEPPPGADVVLGRLADDEALARLAEGARLIIHVAGLVKSRTPAGFLPVNVEGARRMAEAAARGAPDAHVLLISSLSARAPHLSAYAASKAAGEAAVRETLPPARLTVIRPPAIYGPGDRETLALFRAVDRLPLVPSPGPASARLALIHVADAAAQIAELAERPATGATYALADAHPEGYGWREILDEAGRAVGKRPWTPPTPRAAILAIGAAGSLAGRIGPARIMTLGKAREALHGDWSVRPEELAPGPVPARFDLASGFADAVGWYRAKGWL
jgi:nucleoside-diphosphate-sugar epimerase